MDGHGPSGHLAHSRAGYAPTIPSRRELEATRNGALEELSKFGQLVKSWREGSAWTFADRSYLRLVLHRYLRDEHPSPVLFIDGSAQRGARAVRSGATDTTSLKIGAYSSSC